MIINAKKDAICRNKMRRLHGQNPEATSPTYLCTPVRILVFQGTRVCRTGVVAGASSDVFPHAASAVFTMHSRFALLACAYASSEGPNSCLCHARVWAVKKLDEGEWHV